MTPRYLPCGDTGLTVEYGRAVDPDLNARVLQLDRRVTAAAIPGVIETVPTYRSLFVQYDPAVILFDDLVGRLALLESDPAPVAERRFEVPVSYDGEDLGFVAETKGLSPQEVIRLHSGTEYRVYMIGFAPGFTYLGGLPEPLHISRRQEPRLEVPAGSVMIGGIQAAICPLKMPSGWHILGHTRLKPFDLARDPPFLFRPGDLISFVPV